MAQRNVDLLIRARDNASKAFKSVNSALDELVNIQDNVAAGAGKMEAALDKSGGSATALARTIGKDTAQQAEKAAQVFERIEKTVNDSEQAFQRQQRTLLESKTAYDALQAQAESARRAIVDAAIAARQSGDDETNARLKAAQDAYRDLNREIVKTAPNLAKQEGQLADSAKELQRITNAASAATIALGEVSQANRRAQGVTDQGARIGTANQNAERGIKALAEAEADVRAKVIAREAATAAAAAEYQRGNENAGKGIARLSKAEQDVARAVRQRATAQANANAASGIAGLVAAEARIAQAQINSARAAEASARAQAALAASYERARGLARVAAVDQDKLAQAFRKSFTAATSTVPPIRQVVRELARLGPAADQGANGVRRLTGQMANGRVAFRAFYGDSRRALSIMQRLRGEVLSLTASFVGFYGVFNFGTGILEAFQELEAAQNRLGAAFDQDYGKVGAELERLQDEASRLGISFDVLSGNFSKFLISGQQAGLETEQLRTIFRQVSEAGRVLKLSNDQIAGTFNALTQIAGKGTLQMEELRQQLGDRLPGAVGLLATALGYGTDELADFYKAVENGQVGAEEALVALGQGLEDTYGGQLGDALDSTTTKIGELQNLLFERKLTAANSGFISGLDAAIEALNAFLESDEGIEVFERIGAAFGDLFELLPTVLDNLGKLVALFKGFAALRVAQVVSGLGAGLSGLSAQTFGNLRVQVALNRAVASFSPSAAAALRSTTLLGAGLRGLRAVTATLLVTFRAAFGAIGGVVGIAAAALTIFAFNSIGAVDEGMQDLDRTMEDATESIGQVAKAFRDAGGDAEDFKRRLDKISELDLQLDLKNVRAGIAAQTDGNRDDSYGAKGLIKEIQAIQRAINETVKDDKARAYFMRLTALFDQGEISAGELREGIEDLSQRFGEVSDITGLDDFIDWIDQLAEAETAAAKLEAELAVIDGTATEAQRALAGLAETTDDLDDETSAAEKQMQAFEKAMRELGENIPSVNEKLKEFDAIRDIEADFQAAMEAADAFTDAAKRAAAIGQAVDLRNRAYDGLNDEAVSGFDGTDGAKVAAAVLRDSEGFRPNPYNDPRTDRNGNQVGPNIYRAGFGSDTITLSDGTIKKVTLGMSVSVADANRDLMRRINTEFMPAARNAAGAERFDSFNAQQQAALTSIAYNYGELPDRIIAAVRTGSTEEISSAIKSLGGDNGGKNRGRRNKEAALFRSEAGVENRIEEALEAEEDRVEAAEKLAEKQSEFRLGLDEEITKQEFLNSLEGKRLVDAEVAKAIREAEVEAKKVGLDLTEQERAAIEATTRSKYAQAQADEDREASLERARALEEKANLLQERRRFLIEQITELEGQGRLTEAAGLTEELAEVETQLESALEKALAFWQAMGGEGSEKAIQALQQTQEELKRVESTAVTSGRQINDMFADRITSAIDSFTQRVAAGEDAISVFKDEFLKMAGEILIEIGRMIIRQAIFNAISGMMGGGAGGQGGLGGVVAGGINSIFAHSGGVVGTSTLQSGRKVNPAIFANAARYHTGGIAGFAPDEFGAILKKNEEVLTETDPRHRFNGGGMGGQKGNTTIINAFDAEEMMERALSSPRGEEVLINTVRAKRTEIKAAIG